MKRFVLFAAVLIGCMPMHGQILSVYGMFSPVHASNVQTGSVSTSSGYTNQYTSFWAPAVGGGVTLNMLNLHVVKLGLDLRGSTKPGTVGADTAEASIRLGIQPPLLKLKPYGQIGVGYLATRTVNVSTATTGGAAVGGTFSNQYATVGGHVGLDTPIFPFVDFRIAEIGYAHALNTGISFSGTQNANIFSIGTGLVLHF